MDAPLSICVALTVVAACCATFDVGTDGRSRAAIAAAVSVVIGGVTLTAAMAVNKPGDAEYVRCLAACCTALGVDGCQRATVTSRIPPFETNL